MANPFLNIREDGGESNPFKRLASPAKALGKATSKAATGTFQSGANLATRLLDLAQQPTTLVNQAITPGMELDRKNQTTGEDVARSIANLPGAAQVPFAFATPPAFIAAKIKQNLPEDRSGIAKRIEDAANTLPGMPDSVARVAGMLGSKPEVPFSIAHDVRVDPLNTLGTPLAKGFSAAKKAAQGTGFKLFDMLPDTSKQNLMALKDAATKRFVSPIHRVEEPIKDIYNQAHGDIAVMKNQILDVAKKDQQSLMKTFKDTKMEADSAITDILEKKTLDLGKVDELVPDPKQAEEVKAYVAARRKQFEAEKARKIQAGVFTSEVDDIGYVPHIPTKEVQRHREVLAAFGMDKDLSTINPSQFARKMKKQDGSNYTIKEVNELFAKGKFPGFEGVKIKKFFHDDPVFTSAMSAFNTERQIRAKEFYEGLKQFALPKELAGTGEKIDAAINGQNILEGMRFKPEVKELVTKANNIVFKDEIADSWQKVNSVWKGLVVATPGFNARNATTNFIANAVEGVSNPKHYAAATQIQNGAKGAVGKISYDKIREEFIRQGLDQGAFNEDFGRSLYEALDQTKFSEKPFIDKFSQVMKPARDASQAVENNAKLAHFVAKLEEGKSFKEAAESVKKTLFDYSDLSEFERTKMKDVIPFYTWMRKNIPRQFELAATKPTYLSKQAIVGTNVEDSEPVTKKEREATPDYFDSLLAVSFGKSPETNKRIFAAISTPLTDLARFKMNPDKSLQDNVFDSMREFAGGLNPFYKIGVEATTQKSLFTGQDLAVDKQKQLSRAPEWVGLLPTSVQKLLGVKVLKKTNTLVMPKGYGVVLNNLTVPQARMIGKIAADTGKPLDDAEAKAFSLMSFIGGLKFIPVDMKKQMIIQHKNKMQERREARSDRKRFKDVEDEDAE